MFINSSTLLLLEIKMILNTILFSHTDNSEEQIFRVLFRVKLITKNYSDICDPIFTYVYPSLLLYLLVNFLTPFFIYLFTFFFSGNYSAGYPVV